MTRQHVFPIVGMRPLGSMPCKKFQRCHSLYRLAHACLGLVITLFLAQSVHAQSAPGWTLSFNDEFNGTQLDLTKWNTSYMWGGCGQRTLPGNGELEVYLDNQFEEGNGILRIRADKQTYTWGTCGTFNYVSGVITSYQKFAQQNGYFEIRCKLPKGKGLWPAFWMLDNRPVWPPEIDIFEVLGDQPSNPHIGAISASTGAYYATFVQPFPIFDTSADFHTYGLEWTPTTLTYYMDGKQVGQTYAAANMNEPMQVIANLAVGGNWPGAPDASTVFPAYYDIDYIRVWTRADPSALVPGATPTGLTATPGNAETTLSWTAVNGAISYNVKRSTVNFGPYTTIATGVTTPNYRDTGLANGTTYFYTVTSVTSGGESPNAAQACVTPASGAVPNRVAVADAFVRDGSYANTNYGGDPSLLVKSDATGYNRESFLRFDVSGLANATSVKVRLVPINLGSAAVTTTLNFSFVPDNTWTETGITWSNKPASTDIFATITGFQQGFPVDIDVTSWAKTQAGIDGLLSMRISSSTPGSANYVTFGSNDQTILTASQPVLLIVGSAPVPPAPTGLSAMAGSTQVSLSWTASSGAASYNVKRATVSGGPYTTISSPTATSYVDTGLANGTTYYYVVSALNTAGESPNSTEVSATPTASVPPAPSGLSATAGSTQVSLSWTASSGAASYNVKRATVGGGPYTTISNPTTTSYVDTGLANGTTYYYVVSALNTAGESPNSAEVNATPTGTTPPSFTDIDVGGPGVAGSASYSNGIWTLNGSGADISLTSDQFNYAYRSVMGDTTIVARVSSQQNTNAWAKSGVMIRETLSTYSRHVDVVMTPANGVAMDYRSSTSGSTTHLAAANSYRVPYWVKLTRAGNTFTGYVSSDGVTWTQVGTVTFSMASGATEGLAVCSHNNGVLNTSAFDHVTTNP